MAADPQIAMVEPQLVEIIAGVLRGRSEVRLALLFGSRARGRARPDSDVDVAVEGEGKHAAARWRTRAILQTETDALGTSGCGMRT